MRRTGQVAAPRLIPPYEFILAPFSPPNEMVGLMRQQPGSGPPSVLGGAAEQDGGGVHVDRAPAPHPSQEVAHNHAGVLAYSGFIFTLEGSWNRPGAVKTWGWGLFIGPSPRALLFPGLDPRLERRAQGRVAPAATRLSCERPGVGEGRGAKKRFIW